MAYFELRSLSKSYGTTTVVDDFNLSVEAGEFVALLGPSGCGKTTTLRMIAGFVTPAKGEIWIKGKNVTGLPPHRRNVGLVFQNYALFPHMTVRANIEFGLKSHRVDTAGMNSSVSSVLELVGLEQYADRYPRELSGGQQQRVALARVLALKPDLLLFDEPLSNLDAKLRVQMREEIRRLQRESGLTALFVTHDQEEAMSMADRIVVLEKGHIAQVGTPGEIYDHPKTRFVADFIGTANCFEGAVISLDGRRIFRCESGLEIELSAANAYSGSGTIAVRPEKIEFAPSTTSHALHGVIRRATPLGATMEYAVELTSGDQVIVQEQKRPRVVERRTSDPVWLTWQVSDTIFLQS
jgi:putative spermidine/putrescine transport system ATP-binding protein